MILKQSGISYVTTLCLGMALIPTSTQGIQDISHDSAALLSHVGTPDILQALLKRVLTQINTIDLALEELAQAVNNNSIKVNDKKITKEYLIMLRTFISKVRKEELLELNKHNLDILLDINTTLIEHLNESLTQGFKGAIPFDTTMFTPIRKRMQLDPATIKKQLDICDEQLSLASKKFDAIGLSQVNRLTKQLEHINKDWHITAIGKRLLPYVGLGIYYTLITGKDQLPTIPGLKNLKDIIGNMPKKEKVTVPRPNEEIYKGNKKKLSIQPHDKMDIEQVEKDKFIPGTGILGTPLTTFGKFVTVDAKPFYTFTAATLMAPIIKKDAKDLGKWTVKQGKKALAYLKGESFDDGSPIKKSKISFKDIVGLSSAKQQLNRIVEYFKKKDMFDRMGIQVAKGYLLVGPLDTGKSLAQAIAGEITNEFKVQDKKTICGIYEIHASSLLQKELKEIIKEAEEASPCIVVIDELDWLSNQKSVDPKIWSDLVTSMSGVLKSAKKQVFIMATAQKTDAIDEAIKDQGRLGITLHFDKPSAQEREVFFEHELTDRCMILKDFNIQELAQQTEQCSCYQLTAIMKRSLSIAHAKDEILNQNHIEQSIDEIIYGIMPQSSLKQETEKQLLAAHYAGKALAHKILAPQSRLLKVTILPVAQYNNTLSIGALITTKPADMIITDKEIENECLIELAGPVAQKIINGHVSNKLAHSTKQFVFAKVKEMVFEGITEKDLPKEVRAEKLAYTWKLIDSYLQQITDLLQENKASLHSIAQTLAEKNTLTWQELINL